jgi:hypothetical protein
MLREDATKPRTAVVLADPNAPAPVKAISQPRRPKSLMRALLDRF